MSKIYEALLRAEQERANKTGAGTNGVQTAEEVALANTLDPYVPEPQPQFQTHAHLSYSRPVPPVQVEATSFAAAPYPLPLATEPPSLAPLPPISAAAAAPLAVPYPIYPPVYPPANPQANPAEAIAAAHPLPLTSEPPSIAPLPAPAVSHTPPAPAAPLHMQPAAAPVPIASAPVVPSPPTGFDPNTVRTVPWNPVLERLPSLGERGQSIEQFRSLRSRLAEFRDSSVQLKSLLVTSGLPQEGKSFIAANLALSLSRHRANRVLLIDGDIRRSSLHAILGTTAEPGLTEYLSGKAELSEVLQRCIPEDPEPPLHSGLTSLTFIGGGSEPDKAADLSGNPRFAELLSTVSPHFDWIIIDSSPVNLVSDGVNFARACDGVLLVAREGVTKFEVAQNAQQQLKSARILGFVLNAVHTASAKSDEYNYGPYGTYGSYGGYGYSTTKR